MFIDFKKLTRKEVSVLIPKIVKIYREGLRYSKYYLFNAISRERTCKITLFKITRTCHIYSNAQL